MEKKDSLSRLCGEIESCAICPRLTAWREKTAREKTKRFAEETYWGKPLAGFGDPSAGLVLVGLAPAAHGGNRTGRMFTGDNSGVWLFRALHGAGFANRPESVSRNDDLTLKNCYVTAAVRCAPPENKPARGEFESCRPFLFRELRLLHNMRVIVGLGKIGFDSAFSALREIHRLNIRPRPAFGHGKEYRLAEKLTLLGSYHPSQQNTFTRKLTEEMLDQIFRRAKQLLK